MVWVTELLAAIIIIGALVLTGVGRIDFQQALTLIYIAIGIIGGKQLARLDKYLTSRYASTRLLRKFEEYISAIAVSGPKVKVYILPEYFNTYIHNKILEEAIKTFIGKQVEVVKGERIKFV
jgi:hypothetical protein